jgi:hypothetical protein
MRHYLHIAAVIAAMLLIPVGASANEVEMVVASQEPLLRDHENTDREFYKLQIGDTVSYFHQRMIGEAIVEKDFIRYQFSVSSAELIENTVQWRDDLPQALEPVITQEQAESMVEGSVEFSALYFISPDSDVFPITPTPKNPCWAVRSLDSGWPVVTVIDAITGANLGYGIPPPLEAFSLGGPNWGSCDPYYTEYALHAMLWFQAMGYDTQMLDCPSEATVRDRIQSHDVALFYELAHGDSWSFHNECPDSASITAGEVETWIGDYASMAFTFVGSCGGMCDGSDGHLSYEFRKGLSFGAAVVGYCGMNTAGCEDPCWPYAIEWQDVLFTYLAYGWSVEYAYDHANLAYPACAAGDCMRTAGDTGMTLVPKAIRSLCGDVYDGYFGPLEDVNTRPYYLTCDIHVPSGQTLTCDYGISVGFLNNARIIADGTAQASSGNVWFVREMEPTVGMKVGYFGRMQMMNGGTIRVYE